MRIGLLGGTFNPIHNCHLQIAQEIQERFPLDRILFIPSGIPPHKVESDIPSGAHRLEMTRLALLPYPRFKLSDIEVRRSGPSYSVDTLRALLPMLEGEVYFILGVDAFLGIETWKEHDRLLAFCHFIVVSRPEHPFSSLRQIPLIGPVDPVPLKKIDTGEIDRYTIIPPSIFGTKTLTFLKVRPCLMSATDVRKRLQEGTALKNFLPEAVRSYIMKNNLYAPEKKRGETPKR
jgi:nicotinate-nucleotide adenylyltransferase